MELGALVCIPRQPRCDECPVRRHCEARKTGRTGVLPNVPRRPRAIARRFAAFLVQRRSRWLVQQRPTGVVNAHLWEFPNIEIPDRTPIADAAARLFGSGIQKLAPLTTIRHSITRYRISVEASLATLADRGPSRKRANWLSFAELDRLPFTGAHRKLFDTLRRHQGMAADS